MSVAGAGAAWLAVCAPRSRVMVEYTARGGESTMLPGASVTVRVRRPAAGRVTGTNRLRRPRQGDQGAAGGHPAMIGSASQYPGTGVPPRALPRRQEVCLPVLRGQTASQPVRARTTVRLPPSARGRTDAAGADPRPQMRIRLCVRSLWGGDALALSARNGSFVRPGPSRLGVPPFFRGGTPSHPAPAGRERKRSVPPLPPRQP